MNRFWVRIFLILISVSLSGCVTFSYRYKNFCPKTPKSCRFATYNIFWQSRNCHPKIQNSTVRLINTIDADILVIQESTHFWQTCLNRHLKKKYPYQLFHDCDVRSHEDGLGIISKYPIKKCFFIPKVYGWFPACVYIVATPCGHLQVLNVHLNPPLVSDDNVGFLGYAWFTTPKIREAEVRDFTRYLIPNIPTIVAGDFNESDDGRAVQYLKRHAYNDALSCVEACVKTWYWRWSMFTLFGRYDHIMYSSHIRPIHCQVLQEGSSDHFPVVLDFRAGCVVSS